MSSLPSQTPTGRNRSKSLHASNNPSVNNHQPNSNSKITPRQHKPKNITEISTIESLATHSEESEIDFIDKSIYTVESLEKEVELIQGELEEVLAQKTKLDSEHTSVEQSVSDELEIVKAKRKADETSRAQIKSESKILEETKHQLDTQRVKLDKANKLFQAELDRKLTENQKWINEIKEARSNFSKHEKSIQDITFEGESEVSAAQEQLEAVQKTISEIDDDIKNLTNSLKRSDIIKNSSIEALNTTKTQTDKVTGMINEDYVSSLLENPDVHDKLKEAIKSELECEIPLEEEWKQTQKDLETRYMKVYVEYNDTLKTYEQNKQTQQEFNPVYEAVVTATSAAAAAAGTINVNGNGNSGSVNSTYPTLTTTVSGGNSEFHGEPIAPSVSNISSGKKRRNRSRRNTKSQASGSFIGSPQQGFLTVASSSPAVGIYSNGAPLSPASIHSRNVGSSMEHEPDSGLFTPLTTSRSSASITNGPVNWDLPRPPVPTIRTSDIQSPTVLLPSYLLKDDGTDASSTNQNGINSRNTEVDMQFIERLATNGGRPSGSILGRALHKRENSHDSLHSAIGSVGSITHDGSSADIPASNGTHGFSPQASFNHLFKQPSTSSFGISSNINSGGADSPNIPEVPTVKFNQDDTMKHQSTKGRFGSMFFFGKPRNQDRNSGDNEGSSNTQSAGHSLFFRKTPHKLEISDNQVAGVSPAPSFGNSDEVSLIGRRRRSGSLNSVGSLPISLGESFNGSGMLNLWQDSSRSNTLEPSRSHISTTLSIDRNPTVTKPFVSSSLLAVNRSGFDSQTSSIGWSAFSNPNRTSGANSIQEDNQLEATWDHMPNNTISHDKADESALDAQLSEISGNDASSPSQPSKGRFSKGFASLFSSSVPSSSAGESTKSNTSNTRKSLDENHEEISTGNSVSDAAISIETDNSKNSSDPLTNPLIPQKENILQKSIRTLSLPKRSSTISNGNSNTAPSTSKSKFNMRRLSMFSKKGANKEVEEELEVMTEENKNGSITPLETEAPSDASVEDSMDFQEFLANAHKDVV